MSKRWLLFDVGCIECGEESQPIGTYETKEEAEKAREEFLGGSVWGHPGWGGQHFVEIYDLDNIEYEVGI